tara:strand:+ start:85 stop:312 length:228 start_codon:yes stop_codon:yes gene_type:complete
LLFQTPEHSNRPINQSKAERSKVESVYDSRFSAKRLAIDDKHKQEIYGCQSAAEYAAFKWVFQISSDQLNIEPKS